MSNTEFAGAKLTMGQLNAIVKKLGGYAGAIRFLQGETGGGQDKPEKLEDPVFYLSIPPQSLGLGSKFRKIGYYASIMTHNIQRTPWTGKLVVLKGIIWDDGDRNIFNIRRYAQEHGLSTPEAGVARLIQENIGDDILKQMGITALVVMHNPIMDEEGNLALLYINSSGDLGTVYGHAENEFGAGCAFVFVR